jgi:hypothetical protein
VAEAVEEAMKSNKKPFTSSSRAANTAANTSDSKNIPSASSNRDYPPKLTDDERRLLMEFSGCLKCRKFFAGHRAHQCTTTISGKGYKTLTAQDANRAKNAYNAKAGSSQLNTVASVSDATTSKDTEDFIAAVFLNLSSNLLGDGTFSDNSDSSFSSVSPPPHIKSKHFIWNCSLTGPAVTFPVTKPALIDNGCHMVLIRPDTVAELGLPIFELKNPEEVDVAISFSKVGIERKKHSLVQYVKIRPFSSDSVFHSRLVHAVICPGLCMPIIFGLPFLEINDVICDHKNRTCLVKDNNLNYNLLQPIKRQDPPPPKLGLRDQLLRNKSFKKETLQELLTTFPIKWKDRFLPEEPTPTPNFIATILHRIKTLDFEVSMTQMDINLRKSFPKVFQPIPHIDELPLTPLARITLRDAEKTIKTRN